MADLFLVFCIYALMLAAGPCAAWALGRKSEQELQRKKRALHRHLSVDPAVLLEAKSDARLAFTAVREGVDLHVRERMHPVWGKIMSAHTHGIFLPQYATLHLGLCESGGSGSKNGLTLMCRQFFGARMEARASHETIIRNLWWMPEVRDAIADVFRSPLKGLALDVDGLGRLEVWVALDYEPEIIQMLCARTMRLSLLLQEKSQAWRNPEGVGEGARAKFGDSHAT